MLLVKGLLGDNRFDPALKRTAFKKNTMLTFETFNTYVSAKPDYLPFIAAAGMLLLEANHITKLYL